MKSKKAKKQETAKDAPGNIGDYLNRMIADAEEVSRRLLNAPLDMTAGAEPVVFECITRVKSQLVEARAVWGI